MERRYRNLLWMTIGWLAFASSVGQAAMYTEPVYTELGSFGTFPNGSQGTISETSPLAVSDNGIVVGDGGSATGQQAFQWSSSGGLTGLVGSFGLYRFSATSISADGAVIAGNSFSSSGETAFKWTAGGGLVALGSLGAAVTIGGQPFLSKAVQVSADGNTIFGNTSTGSAFDGFAYTSGGGMVALGLGHGGSAFSDNGSVVASGVNGQASRWTSSTGNVPIGALPGYLPESVATSISGDGSTIVGWSYAAPQTIQGFRWTAGDGMVSLGGLPGTSGNDAASMALGVSWDGSRIVGLTAGPDQSFNRGFIWDAVNGLRDPFDLIRAAYGPLLSATLLGPLVGNLYYSEADAISPNGRFIVGKNFRETNTYDAGGNFLSTADLTTGWMIDLSKIYSLPTAVPVHSRDPYQGIQLANPGALSTTAEILSGTASAGTTVTLQSVLPTFDSGVRVSDVIQVSGTGTDTFALQMSYNGDAVLAAGVDESKLVLGWYSSALGWINSVYGNDYRGGGAPYFAGDTPYNPLTDFHLGWYGVDTEHNFVWAVINHNSEFTVLEDVPEPSIVLLLLVGGGLAYWASWRRCDTRVG